MDVSRDIPAPNPEPSARPRSFGRRTALACLAAFAVSWAYGLATLSLSLQSHNIYYMSMPDIEPLTLDFWTCVALAAVPLAAFAAAGAYCWRRARSCGAASRAKAIAVLAPLACAVAWFAIPAALRAASGGWEASLSPESFLSSTVDIWVRLPYMPLAVLCVSAFLGMTAPMPGPLRTAPDAEWPPPAETNPVPPEIKSHRRRTTLASLAAFAVSALYGSATWVLTITHLPFFPTDRPDIDWLSLDFWACAGLAAVPLAAFAAAGTYGWRRAGACGDADRARHIAVRTPLKAAIAWYLAPAALFVVLFMGDRGFGGGYSPLNFLLWPVLMWALLPSFAFGFILSWIV